MDRLRGEYDIDDDASDEEKSEDTSAVDALEQYWTYTKSYMANQEPLKPERLHTIFRYTRLKSSFEQRRRWGDQEVFSME